MGNDARVALVGEENATSKKLMISAAMILTRVINGVHRVRMNTFLLNLPIFYMRLKPVIIV